MSSEENNSGVRIYAIIITLLFLLAAFFAWRNWSQNKTLVAANEMSEARVDSLLNVRSQLQAEIAQLQTSVEDLTAENEALEGRVAASAGQITQKQAEVQKLLASNAKTESALRGEIDALKAQKTEFETIIKLLSTENETLRKENTALKTENAELKGTTEKLASERDDLAKQLAEQIKKTQSAKFKASAFRVEVEKRGDRLTTKAKKVREVGVSFDLADVPEQYQGAQKLYLVITDDKGVPIKTANPIKATIYAPAGDVEIIAANVRPVNLGETQRISFVQKIDDKLKKGNYVVAVYCDKGLLGASSFKLT